MDYYPLIPKADTPRLPDGVMIIYEREDINGMLDYLSFLISYKTLHKEEEASLPDMFCDGENVDAEVLFAQLKDGDISEADDEAESEIATALMDSHRKFFEEYMNHLEGLILTKSKEPEEDTDHPLYDTYDFFIDVEIGFFPLLEEMN